MIGWKFSPSTSRLKSLRQLEPPIGNSLKPIEEANRNSRASSSGPRSALLDGGAGLAKASQTLSERAHCRTLHWRYVRAMAVWQFVINLIPASAASIAGVKAARMSRAQLDDVVLALPIAEADVLFAKLDMLLPEKPRSYTGLRVWGDEPSDDIQVSFDDEFIDEIQVRFDVADISLPLIGGVCDVARHFDCVFATPEGAIIQPSREAVVRTVLQSDAAHFVQDPQGFVEKAVRLDREDLKGP